ncbi:hypothetical protein EZV62_021348 [Acer yangbiense]|uniref:Protein TIC 20 n=1 Tax=Acer yangbiense TaxID=1000413 RepID=A0A5C7H629_9ROSI|nr:hypothetical protein EZV62_021348 [Acer yangbiense]
MGMLLEIGLQVIGTVSRWLPLGLYWGKLVMHFWTAMAFAFLFTVLECIRCALAGIVPTSVRPKMVSGYLDVLFTELASTAVHELLTSRLRSAMHEICFLVGSRPQLWSYPSCPLASMFRISEI